MARRLALVGAISLGATLCAAVQAEQNEALDFVGRLEAVGKAFQTVARKLHQSKTSGDEEKAENLLQDAVRLYEETVKAPLDQLISTLEPRVEDDDQAHQQRNLAELSRIRFLLLYAGMLPEGSDERREALEKGLDLASFFVDRRGYYLVMQCEALIQKALFLIELERYEQAAGELEILYDIDPGTDPPYSPSIVTAFKDIRLKALLFGARALNGASRYREAVSAIQEYYVNLSPKHPFYLGDAEEIPALKQNAVLLKLEYGVALTGAGEPEKGLAKIHEVIDKYSEEGEEGETFVVDARKALGKIAASGEVTLSGRDYYQAAIGLKSELKFKESLRLFQKALATLAPEDIREYAPLCLNEIGEVSFLLGRQLESAVAYQEIARHFPRSSVKSKVTKNFLGAATQLQEKRSDHAGIQLLREEANKYEEQEGDDPDARYQALMVDGNRLLDEGKLAEARKKYLEVPRNSESADGEKIQVSFYWRAQAMARRCTFLQWDRAAADEKAQLSQAVEEATQELAQIIDSAREDREPLGVAVAALTLGQIHYNREEWAEAVAVLDIFMDELADDDVYRSMALGFLVLSATHVPGGGEKAEAAFKQLYKNFPEDCAAATAAYAMADYFAEAGGSANNIKAAFYMEIYAEHPCSKPDLQNLPLVMKIVQVLIEGKMTAKAREYIEVAKRLAEQEGAEAELDRQLLFMEAKIFYAKEDYAGTIRVLEEYRKKYGAEGQYFEDPYVWQMMAESYYRYRGADGKLKPTQLARAEQYYDVARSILYRGLPQDTAAGSPEAEQAAALRKLYWKWVYRWLNFKYLIGSKLGKPTELREIIVFIEESQDSDMAGYKKYFLKLKEKAERAANRSASRRRR